MLSRVAAIALLLLLVPVQAGLQVKQDLEIAPSTLAPPVTLTSLNANTDVASSGTSATTSSAISLPALGGTVNTLRVTHGATAQDLVLRVTGRSGFSLVTDTVTVSLGSATTTVTMSNSLPRSTASVDIGTVSDITISAAGICLGTCTLTIQIRIDPDGVGTSPTIVYPYTLVVT